VTVSSLIRDCLDTLLHPSARRDALAGARHRAFIAPRLFGSLTALAAFPVYLALHGAPTGLEVVGFAWLTAPILLSYFLSRTGRYEAANLLSSLALAGLVLMVAINTGGIASFAAIWLVVIPLEAALSASRRVVAFASALAIGCALLLVALTHFDLLPPSQAANVPAAVLMAAGIISALLYGCGLAYCTEALGRTSVALLNAEEERYRLLARNMSDVISCHSRDGAVQFISPAVEAMLGTPARQLLGHGLFDRVHVIDRPAFLTALSDAGRGGEARSVEFRLRRDVPHEERLGAGEFIWVELRCRPLDHSAASRAAAPETEVVAVMRDVSARKHQEQALEQARAEAERADTSRSRFLATVSHELRTPLNAIIGFSEMIVRDEELLLDAARRREYAQLINDSGQHLLSVVNGILDMSKMEAGSFEIEPEPFAPRPALVNCCDLLALKAREAGIDLVARAPDDLPDVDGDPRAFKQILLNLVSNAIKFTERGGSVTVSAAVEGTNLALRVTDTGVGIAADDLKRIGDPFFQAGKTYQRRHEGTGLGLSIVKTLVALHGGTISVASKLNEGTTVSVLLPLTAKAARALSSKIATIGPASPAPIEIRNQQYQVKKSA
jgi:cell cycle sensor histidine kinase DivJ